jgi:hypothetical protein
MKRNLKLIFAVCLFASIDGAAVAQNKISVGVGSAFSFPTGNFRAFAGSGITPEFQFKVGLLENLILGAKFGYTDWSEKVATIGTFGSASNKRSGASIIVSAQYPFSNLGPFKFYGSEGIGVYFLKSKTVDEVRGPNVNTVTLTESNSSQTNLGTVLGLGSELTVSSIIGLDLNTSYYTILTQTDGASKSFVGVTISVLYQF